ncbi:MAG: leucine-rich repeat protein [Muribaculaceae bacterium]|nr:leucine-rich repeat protein [Muribaculaceae bacterium]
MKKPITTLRLMVMAIMLCCTSLSLLAFDIDGMSYEVNNEVNKTVTLTKGKSSLTNITVPETVTNGGVTYTVNTIGEDAFYQCEIPGVLDLPATVVVLQFCAFQQLTGSSVRIRGDLQSVDYGAFYGNKLQAIICYATTYFTHDMGVLTNKEKTMIIAFPGRPTSDKWSSANLSIPEGYEYIAPYAFTENPNLTSITIPTSVKEIGVGAFQECPNLKTVTILDGNTVVRDRAFMGCEQVTSLNLPTGMKTVGHSAFFDLAALKTLTLPEGMIHTGINSFANCGLTTLNLPSTLKNIGDRSFMNNIDLHQINLSESVDTIEYSAFYGCDLTAIDLKNVKWIGGQAFCNNYNLASVDCSNNQLDFMGNALFYGCRSLTGITLPESLREMESSTFYLCTGLNSLTIPANVEVIGAGITVGTTALNEIQIDPANTHFDVKDGWLYTSDLKRIVAIPGAVSGVLTIPEGVTTIGAQAGRRLAITELETPRGLKTLEFAAFMQCTQLAKVTLSATVDSIAGNVFANCPAITEVTSLNRVPPVGGVFVEDVYNAATLYVPRGYKEAYQADENWGKFLYIEEIDVEEPGVVGDLNGDGVVDVADVNICINIILELNNDPEVKALADLNGDGVVDVADVNAIINIILQ